MSRCAKYRQTETYSKNAKVYTDTVGLNVRQTVTDGQRLMQAQGVWWQTTKQTDRQSDVQVSRRTQTRKAKVTRGLTYIVQIDMKSKYIIICISIFDVDDSSV